MSLNGKLFKLLVDAAIAGASLILAHALRHDGVIPPEHWRHIAIILTPVIALRTLTSIVFGQWNCKWRYVTITDVLLLVASAGGVSALMMLGWIVLQEGHVLRIGGSIIVLDFLIVVCAWVSARVLWRVICERRDRIAATPGGRRRLLILGAGFHGATVVKEMLKVGGAHVVAFLDDDPHKMGTTVAGVPVLGPTSKLDETVSTENIDEVLVCIPPVRRAVMAGIPAASKVRLRIIPTVEEILMSPDERRDERVVGPAPLIGPFSDDTDEPWFSGLKNKRILITGGAGFIGSSLAQHLVMQNELVLMDLQFDKKPIEFTSLLGKPNVRLVEGDILDPIALEDATRRVDVVVHTAAVLGVSRVCNGASETLETNYVGTSRLLQALKRNKRLERFVHFSTSEVFGVNSYRVDETTPPTVGPIAESRWSYAISKLASEHLVKSYHRETGMPVVIVRPFNIFGPRRTGDNALSRFILNALNNQPLLIHGDGTQIRSWCYIEDFCKAMVAMLEVPDAIGEDFNVGNTESTITVKDLARKVIEMVGSRSPLVFVEHPFPDISIRVPSLAKAQRLLGYQPQIDLETGLNRTIHFYRRHLSQFANLASVGVSRFPSLASAAGA